MYVPLLPAAVRGRLLPPERGPPIVSGRAAELATFHVCAAARASGALIVTATIVADRGRVVPAGPRGIWLPLIAPADGGLTTWITARFKPVRSLLFVRLPVEVLLNTTVEP